jgi:N utilization substance protein A
VSDELGTIEGVTAGMLVVLGQNEIRTLDDLGDLASDELIEMLGDTAPSVEAADAIIMAARAHWFADEAPAEEAAADEAQEGTAPADETAAASADDQEPAPAAGDGG